MTEALKPCNGWIGEGIYTRPCPNPEPCAMHPRKCDHVFQCYKCNAADTRAEPDHVTPIFEAMKLDTKGQQALELLRMHLDLVFELRALERPETTLIRDWHDALDKRIGQHREFLEVKAKALLEGKS